ncbi:integrase core domain protein [Ancylostoma ceylanicum]|uniref:RNA-directed DNA polymerase n=1 Tax=Ancylostoma ceylanicum TaxID=53326 RepID=A0A0D6L5S2_9BILA|nr:integrase core domain protein [Ancylostoma ceylanicum]
MAVRNFPTPTNAKEVKRFVGMWGNEQQSAFAQLRDALLKEPILGYPDYDKPFHIFTDASSVAQAARWMIEIQSYNIKIVHISGKQNAVADALSRAEEGRTLSPSQHEELKDIAEFPFSFCCAPVTENPLCQKVLLCDSDNLIDFAAEQKKDSFIALVWDFCENRTPTHPTTEEVKITAAELAAKCAIKKDGCLYIAKGAQDSKRDLLLVPDSLKSMIFRAHHSSALSGGHMGFRKTLSKITRKYFWPSIYSDILKWCKECVTCQMRRNPKPEFREKLIPVHSEAVFAKVGLDLCGPLRTTDRGNKYILNIVCWFTRYVISVPLQDARATTIAHALLTECVLKYGAMSELISDQASSFTSNFYKEFCNLLHIQQKFATPYHSMGNGATERTFRTFQLMLSKFINNKQEDWDLFVPCVTFCYNTSVNEATGETPYFLMSGRDPIFVIDRILQPHQRPEIPGFDEASEYKAQLVSALKLAWSNAADHARLYQVQMKRQYDRNARPSDIKVGDRVLYRNFTNKVGLSRKLCFPWIGQFRVIDVDFPHATIVSITSPRSQPKQVHLNQIKKFIEPTGPASTLPSIPEEEASSRDIGPVAKQDITDDDDDNMSTSNHQAASSEELETQALPSSLDGNAIQQDAPVEVSEPHVGTPSVSAPSVESSGLAPCQDVPGHTVVRKTPKDLDSILKKARGSHDAVRSEQELLELLEQHNIQPIATDAPSGSQSFSIITASEYKATHGPRKKPQRKERATHSYSQHPWAHLFASKLAPVVSPNYNAELPADSFETITPAGYSCFTPNALFRKQNQGNPTASNNPSILDAVSPWAIESFRNRNDIMEMLVKRDQGAELPSIPDAEEGDALDEGVTVEGLITDKKVFPVLYRVKTLFGSGAKKETALKVYMNGSRSLVTINKSRALKEQEFYSLKKNDFISALSRDPQLPYMVFCCYFASLDARRELRAHMADVIYIPPPPQAPLRVTRALELFRNRVKDKLNQFKLFKFDPQRAPRFLDVLYSTTCGAILACVAAAADHRVYSVLWSSPDINSHPAIVTFQIPLPARSGWSVGHSIGGAYDVDTFNGTITHIVQAAQTITVTAQLTRWDTPRWRQYLSRSPNQQLAVGNYLAQEGDKANPTLSMLENCCLEENFAMGSPGLQNARAILSHDIELQGVTTNRGESITVATDSGPITLNQDQVNAVNLFRHRFPIMVVDSAYGAGKTVCTAVMTETDAKAGRHILVTSVQNNAVDVIAAKIAQLNSPHIRPVRFVSEKVIADTNRFVQYDLATLLERLHLTHADQLEEDEIEKFTEFADNRQQLREFVLTGTDPDIMKAEHSELLMLERNTSKHVKQLVEIFLRVYNPNVFLCTVASALNITAPKGLLSDCYDRWASVLLDEASMLPEAVLITLLSRFQNSCFTLIGDSKQLPPYVGTQAIPLAVELCSQSALDIANRRGNTPTCPIQIVYRPHVNMMSLNSEVFYDGTLVCGTPPERRMAVLQRMRMPNQSVPVAFIEVPSEAIQSVTRSYRNEAEAQAVHVLVRNLLIKGFHSREIMVISLYKDQKLLCEQLLNPLGVSVGTVDSEQGAERTVVILCTTRTSIPSSSSLTFFCDPRRLNVALSRARDGLFITGSPSCLKRLPIWENVITWCESHKVIVPMEFFNDVAQPQD